MHELQIKEEALAQFIQKAEQLEEETANQRDIVLSRSDAHGLTCTLDSAAEDGAQLSQGLAGRSSGGFPRILADQERSKYEQAQEQLDAAQKKIASLQARGSTLSQGGGADKLGAYDNFSAQLQQLQVMDRRGRRTSDMLAE
eukprot:767231-Hanusia_phi.AAC.9